MVQMGAVVGGPIGAGVWATAIASEAFSASLTTADACKRRTSGRITATYAARAPSLVCLAAPHTWPR
jgi:hypothetical protein